MRAAHGFDPSPDAAVPHEDARSKPRLPVALPVELLALEPSPTRMLARAGQRDRRGEGEGKKEVKEQRRDIQGCGLNTWSFSEFSDDGASGILREKRWECCANVQSHDFFLLWRLHGGKGLVSTSLPSCFA